MTSSTSGCIPCAAPEGRRAGEPEAGRAGVSRRATRPFPWRANSLDQAPLRRGLGRGRAETFELGVAERLPPDGDRREPPLVMGGLEGQPPSRQSGGDPDAGAIHGFPASLHLTTALEHRRVDVRVFL